MVDIVSPIKYGSKDWLDFHSVGPRTKSFITFMVPTQRAAALTSQQSKAKLPTHIQLGADNCGLLKDSVVLLEQIRTIDKRRLKEKMGRLDEPAMNQVDHAITISFGLAQGALREAT